MHDASFQALVVRQYLDGSFVRQVEERAHADLPAGELTVRVHYSSLNYKDALSATGHRGVTRKYPHTPGIDAAGVVVETLSDEFSEGDEVIVIGYDLGMNTAGGFGQYIRIPASWAARRPPTLTMRESMFYGTAGFTAAMSVHRLLDSGVRQEQGDVLVTGATGGVGSIAAAILAKEGFRVVAATGKPDQSRFFADLGVASVIERSEISDGSDRPLLKARWVAVVDSVGGNILATAIKSTLPGGVIACCGNVASHALPTTVYPFILRGVSLLGVDSTNCKLETRRRIWHELAGRWKLPQLSRMAAISNLTTLDDRIDSMLQGKIVGRVVVDLRE